MTQWIDLEDVVGRASFPWRWHLERCGIEIPDDATEEEGHAAAMNLRELILRHWEQTGMQSYIGLEDPNMHSHGGNPTVTRVLPDLAAIGGGPTRFIPRYHWPLVDPIRDAASDQMALF